MKNKTNDEIPGSPSAQEARFFGLMVRMEGSKSVIGVFTALFLVLCFASVFSLDKQGKASRDELLHSHLIYTSRDLDTARAADYLRKFRTIDVICVESVGSSEKVKRIAGSNSVATPLLAVNKPSGFEFYSGTFAVLTALEPVLSKDNAFAKGVIAILVSALIVICTVLVGSELTRLVSLVPFIGFVGLTVLQGNCLACKLSTSTFSSIAPIIGCLYVGVGALVFTFRVVRQKWLVALFAACSGAVPIIQLAALVNEPRLCPACLIVTFTATTYFVAAIYLLFHGNWRYVAAPKTLRPIVVCVLCTLIFRDVLGLSGTISTGNEGFRATPNLVGHRLGEYIKGGYMTHGGIYLVTLEGCHECEKARKDFIAHQLPFTRIEASITSRMGYFSIPDTTFPVPIILVCDGRDRIIYQRNGWTSSEGALGLRQTLEHLLQTEGK